jgi:hypothetical protein
MAFFRGDVWIVRLDEKGNVLWDRRYGDNLFTWVDSGCDIRPRPDGGFTVLASTGTAGPSDDLWLLGLDDAGRLQWNATYGGASFDQAGASALTDSGDSVLVGQLGPGPALPADVLALRVGPEGGLPQGPGCDIDGRGKPNAWGGPVLAREATVEVFGTPFPSSAASAFPLRIGTHVALCNR